MIGENAWMEYEARDKIFFWTLNGKFSISTVKLKQHTVRCLETASNRLRTSIGKKILLTMPILKEKKKKNQ